VLIVLAMEKPYIRGAYFWKNDIRYIRVYMGTPYIWVGTSLVLTQAPKDRRVRGESDEAEPRSYGVDAPKF